MGGRQPRRRLAPWQEGTALCLADIAWADHTPVVASPRQILRRQLERLAERGWEALAGTELEFMVFSDTYEQAWDSGYRTLTPANRYNVDYSLLGTARAAASSAGSRAPTSTRTWRSRR